jgi:hypothetical protein
MAQHRPIVLVNGRFQQLPVGDTVVGATVPLFDHFDFATTAGTGLETLFSGDVPGNTIEADGDKLRLYYAGQFPTSNSKDITISGFGSNLLSISTTEVGHWSIDIEIIRNSSTSLRYSATMLAGGSILSKFTGELASLDFTIDTSIDLEADDTTDGDTEAHFGYCVFIPAAIVDVDYLTSETGDRLTSETGDGLIPEA